jgi:predicted RNA-binding protein with TRAM domain
MDDNTNSTNNSTNSRKPLPLATERALLEALLDTTQSAAKFKAVCDRNHQLFGSPSSDLRRRVQKRRQHFKANPAGLQKALKHLVKAPKDSAPEQLSAAGRPPSSSEEEEQQDDESGVKDTPNKKPTSSISQVTPPSSNSSRHFRRMSHLRPKVTSGSTYQLNIDEPWKNPFGILTIKGTKVVEENTVMDKLTIMKPIFDINDFEKNVFQGTLLEDGSGIIITEPTIPGYMWDNVNEIQKLIDADSTGVCEPSLLTFKTIRTDLKKHRELQTTQNTYLFPDGVTCNNEFFNKQTRRSSQLDLDTEMFVHGQKIGESEDGEAIIQYCSFIVFKLGIDGAGKQTEEADEVRGVNKAFARLGIKTKGTKSMDE